MKTQTSDRTTVHLPLKREMVKKVDKLAEAENRTRLNMIVVLLQQALAVRETA